MRNLIVCCDGTWNTLDQRQNGVPNPTNVVRLYNALAETDIERKAQLKYYHPGVGTDGSLWQRLAGGSIGSGLDRNVMSAYRWLGTNYQTGDRIFVFGFSRGAFTVRSLAGMIVKCGLLDLTGRPDAEVWQRVEAAYNQGYRQRQVAWANAWPFHSGSGPDKDVTVFFVGVWDTVGALGIPNDMAVLNAFDDPRKYEFHDTILSEKVTHARHALALDEKRASFTPTIWTGVEGRSNVKQIWFPGSHCDVGGGHVETGLSDGALKWMIAEATGAKLAFRPEMAKQINPSAQDVLHDSNSGVFEALRTQPRSVPLIVRESRVLDASVLERHDNPPITQAPYYSTTTLRPGEQKQFSIYAMQPWNETGLYLEAGARYVFSASGQWLDRDIKCGPGGPEKDVFQAGELVQMAGTLLGKIEKTFQSLTKNEQADFRGTKREENMPWFALVGVIANGGNPTHDGSPASHESFKIGEGCEYPAAPGTGIANPGYLYCFANDAWYFYGNNRGSVTLTVKRLS